MHRNSFDVHGGKPEIARTAIRGYNGLSRWANWRSQSANLTSRMHNLLSSRASILDNFLRMSSRNLEMLTATRTRLETLNQELSQAQQQKIIQESALSQMNVRKAARRSAASPSDVQQELTTLQAQLAALQSRYTDDHPDVRKTKAQIRALQSQLKAANATATAAPVKDEPVVDTAEMRQMRVCTSPDRREHPQQAHRAIAS